MMTSVDPTEEQLEHDLIDGALHQDVERVAGAIAAGVDLAKHGGRAVHTAACMGDAALMRVLLEAGASARDTSTTGRPALHSAAFYGNTEVMGLLISADPSFGLQDALCGAACQNKAAAAALLLKSGAAAAHDGSEALFWAVINDARDVIRLLIEAGAKPEEVANRAIEFSGQRFRKNTREIRATLRWIDALKAGSNRDAEAGQLQLIG